MKDYLSSQEQIQLMYMLALKNCISDNIEIFSNGNLIDKTHMKQLRTSLTYVDKVTKSIIENLDKKEIARLTRRMKTNTLKLYDEYTIKKINKKVDETFEKVTLENEEFLDFCEQIMDVNCKGCNKDWKSCSLNKLFHNNCAPEPVGNRLLNCKYAFK